MQAHLPKSEAPATLIYWTGLFTLASVLKRKVYIPSKYMGSYDIYPNLYVFFVGDAGAPRKTTTMKYTETFLDKIPNVLRSSSALSEEMLMNKLAKSSDGSIMIRAKEFSTLFKTSREKMLEFLVDVYDNHKNHDYETLARGLDYAQNPCINLLAASTPIWIAENLSEAAMGGGFASRVIFIYEMDSRTDQLYYLHLNRPRLMEMEERLLEDLLHIERDLIGPFELSNDAMEFMEPWYRKMKRTPLEDKRIQGYIQRKHVHVHKIAMLIHLSRDDELVLYKSDFEEAIEALEEIEKKLPMTFAAIGKNPYTVDMDNIKEYIFSRERVKRKELLSRFYQAATPSMLLELVNALVAMGDVEISGEGEEMVFVSKMKK